MFATLRFCLAVGASLVLAQAALAGSPALPLADPTGPQATRPGVLTGVVLRADGQPCPGAAVYLAGAVRQLVVTDARGAFQLPGVPAGKPVTVLADYFGLGSTRLVVAVPAGQPLRLTLGQ